MYIVNISNIEDNGTNKITKLIRFYGLFFPAKLAERKSINHHSKTMKQKKHAETASQCTPKQHTC